MSASERQQHHEHHEHHGLPGFVVALNTVSFALSFAAWVALGPTIRAIGEELELPASITSFARTLPILVGSFVRIPIGVLADRVGARWVFASLMIAAASGAVVIARADGAPALLVGAGLLGLAGTTFTVGVQAVTAETPIARQGLAIGIFGAGNVGTALSTFVLPILVARLGWRVALDVYAAALVLGALVYAVLARSHPGVGVTWRALLEPFLHLPVWRIGLYYTASFGVFVAMTLVIVDLYVDVHGVTLERAGLYATTFTASASLERILGGWLADRLGSRRILRGSLVLTMVALAPVSLAPDVVSTLVLVLLAGAGMGMAMSASLREVATAFPDSVGAVTGVVGALGGLGGFVLPNAGAACAAALEAPSAVVLPLALVAALALVVHLVEPDASSRGLHRA
ncbi:MAG: MFS transporter [Sandaracinaceae bacterium]|nr:MFS transporter [Sandaracinaceae bacterium]